MRIVGRAAGLFLTTLSCATPSCDRTQGSPSPVVTAKPLEEHALAADATRVVLLGTGTPVPDPQRAGPSLAVVRRGRALLVDAGPGLVRRAAQAAEAGITPLVATRLEHVFITHLHSDHTAGLPDLMLTPAVVGRRAPLQLFGPKGLRSMVEHLHAAYAIDRSVRERVEGTSEGYGYQVREVTGGRVYADDSLQVNAIRVPHGSFEHAFGYRFETPARIIVVSGDTAPSDALVEACSGCDVLVHEAYCAAGLAAAPEGIRGYHAAFHTSAPQLGTLARRARPALLVLTHLLPFGCSEQQMLDEVRSTYSGEVVIGEDLGVY